MQKYLIKSTIELEFKCNLGDSDERRVFYTSLKKLLEDEVKLAPEEENSLGNIIYRQYLDPSTCLKNDALTDLDEKEADFLLRTTLLTCLLKKFNKEKGDGIIQTVFDSEWFVCQRDELIKEVKAHCPFVFDIRRSIQQGRNFYTFVPIMSALISFAPLNYYASDRNSLEESGLTVNDLLNYSFVAFAVCLASVVGVKEGVSYYRQSNAFFAEQKSIEVSVNSEIEKLDTLIRGHKELSYVQNDHEVDEGLKLKSA
ncbi:hypothetical protein [Legionella beliardensis]|nr:hypothetical protein [Legionella beliardensis]